MGGSSRSDPKGCFAFQRQHQVEFAPSPRVTSFRPPTFISINRSRVTPRQKGRERLRRRPGRRPLWSRIATTSSNFMTRSFRLRWLIFFIRLDLLLASGGPREGNHLVEAFTQASRERRGVGDGFGIEVDGDATGFVVRQHRHHGRDARSGTHRVDARHPRTRQIQQVRPIAPRLEACRSDRPVISPAMRLSTIPAGGSALAQEGRGIRARLCARVGDELVDGGDAHLGSGSPTGATNARRQTCWRPLDRRRCEG